MSVLKCCDCSLNYCVAAYNVLHVVYCDLYCFCSVLNEQMSVDHAKLKLSHTIEFISCCCRLYKLVARYCFTGVIMSSVELKNYCKTDVISGYNNHGVRR